MLRSLIHDIIDLYEINRKEAAAILLDLPSWVAPGTFKPKDAPAGDEESAEASAQSEWVLENMIVEVRCCLPSFLFRSLLPRR